MYPVMLNLRRRPCLIVGGGGVALRKLGGLLDEGADVTVVSDSPCAGIVLQADAGQIQLERRTYRHGEAAAYTIVFAATDNRDTNRQVFEEASAAGVWANVVDDPELCSFHLPARLQRGSLQIALASQGHAPFAVRRMRQLLESRFGHEWSEWADAAARFRRAVRSAGLPRDGQEAVYDQFFAATVDPMALQARVPTLDEEKQWLAAVQRRPKSLPPPTRQASDAPLAKRPAGFVSLVGAGPGDPGLLTVRGAERLHSCSAVVYDRLAATVLPCDLSPTAELHCVGKLPGRHPVRQEEINALLVRLAKEGKRVVRLKGGDPYVFGRGGEEAEALTQAGVPFEIVPCVTAGLGVPAYAGIPVTRRGEASHVTLVTAHESDDNGGPRVQWDKLAADRHGTIVGYMGVTRLPSVVERLLAAGMPPATPAAIVERGTTARQRLVRSPLVDLAAVAVREAVKPPAVFIIGSAARHADTLSWFSSRRLHGERVGVVAGSLRIVAALEADGVEVVAATLPLTSAARVVVGAAPMTGWVLRRPHEVDALEEERGAPGFGAATVAWCLGPAVADRARAFGWPQVVELEDRTSGTALAEAMFQRRSRNRPNRCHNRSRIAEETPTDDSSRNAPSPTSI